MGVMCSFLQMNSEVAKEHVSAAVLWTSEVSASSTRISNLLANPFSVMFWEAGADWSATPSRSTDGVQRGVLTWYVKPCEWKGTCSCRPWSSLLML